jgi:hypothetical protein
MLLFCFRLRKKSTAAQRRNLNGMRKRIVIIFLVICSIVVASISAEGTDWIPITKSKDGNQSVFIDKESIRSSSRHADKDIIRVWVKIVYKKPEPYNSKYISYSLKNYEWFCGEKWLRIIQLLHYYTDGTNEPEFDAKLRQWNKVESGTTEDVIYKYLCEKDN